MIVWIDFTQYLFKIYWVYLLFIIILLFIEYLPFYKNGKKSTQELHEQLDFQSRYNGFLNDLSKFLCFGLDNTVLHVFFCSPASMHTNTPISLLRIWLIPVSGRRSNNKLLCITQHKIWKSSTRNRKKFEEVSFHCWYVIFILKRCIHYFMFCIFGDI